MVTFMVTFAAMTVAMVFLVAVAEHVRLPGMLPGVLRVHGRLPERSVRVVAVAVTAGEGVVGGLTAYGLVSGHHDVLRVGLVAGALLSVGFGLYSQAVLARIRISGRVVPCGCSRLDTPMTGWVVGRAYVLAALAGAGALGSASVIGAGGPPMRFGTAVAAATAFAAVLWVLPHAMRMPAGDQQPARGQVGRLTVGSAHD